MERKDVRIEVPVMTIKNESKDPEDLKKIVKWLKKLGIKVEIKK